MLDPRGDYTLVLGRNNEVEPTNNNNNEGGFRTRTVYSNILTAFCLRTLIPTFRRLNHFFMFHVRLIGLVSCAFLIILFVLYYLLNTDPDRNDYFTSIPSNNLTIMNITENDKRRQQTLSKSGFFKKKIVHLDLKGAAPRPEYLLELFPLFRRLDFTGILIEYEDMFPYHSGLSALARKSAYNDSTIKHLGEAAFKNNLEFIPLLQTFGHLEFALKHREFASLRENPNWMDTICPSNNRSIWLIKEMFSQTRHLHPSAKSIHIGSDEAWHIAQDRACQLRLNTTLHGSVDRLKLEHISLIARMAKEEFGFENVFAWNDMFDKIPVDLLLEYKLGSLLIPVIWGYNRDVTTPGYFPDGLFKRYSHVFEEQYFAGAYKGADGVTQQFVDIDRYMQNLLSYRRLYYQNEQFLKNRLVDMVLTGWQRFNHNRPLCELLPSAIPALIREAIFLTIWEDKKRTKEEMDEHLRTFLDCPQNSSLSEADFTYKGVLFPFVFEIQLGECQFPGVELYKEIEKLNVLRWKAGLERHTGEDTRRTLEALEKEFNGIREVIAPILRKFYFDDTVKEWLAQHTRLSDFKDDDPSVPRFDPIM